MSKIFINYRRDDSAAYAGRLYDRLANHFGRDHIFMDIDQIGPGEDFIEVVQEKLRSVQIAIIMIGKQWLDITDDSGQRRLDNPDDFVRIEITALLERKIRVIPVLVEGAIVPKLAQLPECLAPLVRRNAYEISYNRFHADVDKLIQALEKIIGAQMSSHSTELPKISDPQNSAPASQGNLSKQANTNDTVAKQPDRPNLHHLTIILGTIVIFIVAIIVFNYFPRAVDETSQSEIGQPSERRLPFEPEMVRIPSGKFLMGSPENEPKRSDDESPQHEVTITSTFEISKYEITFDEYDHFAKATQRNLPEDQGWGRGKRPVINVSFYEAYEYAQWLSQQTGKKYRLPTEAEWEYAARAGTQTAYWWGSDIGKNNANCRSCGSEWDGMRTAQAGTFKPNAFGLHDTAGNVWEWTQDCWHENYYNAPADGSVWKETDRGDCYYRVIRGGSWVSWDSGPAGLRSASRGLSKSDNSTSGSIGFRVARDF